MKSKGLSRFLQNSLALLTGMVGQTFLTLLIGKLLTTSLGSTNFGRYNTAVAFAGLLAILWEPGTMRVILRYTAHYEALGERKQIRRLLQLFYGVTVIIGALILAFLALGGVQYISQIAPQYAGLESALLWATLWGVLITLKGITLTAFTGRQQMVTSSAAGLIVLILSLIAFYVLRDILTVESVLMVRVGVGIFVFLATTLWLWRQLREGTQQEERSMEGGLLRDISSFWGNALLLNILAKVYAYADKLIIGGFLPMQYVGFFSTAKGVNEPIRQMIAIPLGAAGPIITTRWERGDKKGAANLASLLVKYTFLIGIYFTIILILLAKPFILLVSSAEYMPAVTMLRLLALAIPPLCITSPLASALQAIGALQLIARIEVVYIAVNLLLNIVLILLFGAQGIALSPALSALVVLAIYLKLVPKHLEARIMAKDLAMICLSGAVVMAIGALTSPLWAHLPLFIVLVLQASLCGVLYYVMLIATRAVTLGERDTVITLIGNRTLSALIAKAYDIPYALSERMRRSLE